MGFRSTLISEDVAVDWPSWFREKWSDLLTPTPSGFPSSVLSQRWEVKTWFRDELPADVHRALIEVGFFKSDTQPPLPNSDGPPAHYTDFSMVWLHECGGITKVQINRDGVRMADPDGWVAVDHQDGFHNYCYGCSDLRKVSTQPLPDPVAT